jgi:gamma-glutamyltranspeptidase / glutathione hydrolase
VVLFADFRRCLRKIFFDGNGRSLLMKTLSRLAAFSLAWLAPLSAQDRGYVDVGRSYGRSMVITQQGLAASGQALASQAAVQILARGGSAADAAIAANAVLAVIEPMNCGPGGDLFMLYREAKSGKLIGLNGSGPAPRGLSAELLVGKGFKTMPGEGIHSVTVPGAVDGWAKVHQRFGRLPWKELFAPAIFYAEHGFPVAEEIDIEWTGNVKRIQAYPETVRVFLPNGRPPQEGDLFRNPDMAATLRLIAEKGRDAVYKGEIAAAILKTSQSYGGTLTAEDLASFSSEWVEPISIDYRGWRVYELPPNTQGMAALEMLNIMEVSPPTPLGALSAIEMHKRIEAMKLAYADVRPYDADPRTYHAPVEQLLSKAYARRRAALIDPNRAQGDFPPGQPEESNTTYLCVVDRDGNIASWIQSNSSPFGSGITVLGMGFILHNRGQGFLLDPNSPDVLAGGKRPFHTIIPAFMAHGDQQIAFGIIGGTNQPLAHAQFVSNFVDYGMNLQAAMDAPRFTKRDAGGLDVAIESRVPAATLRALSALGHQVAARRDYTPEMGRGQAILHDSKTGTNFGASDPRADGAAVPEPVGDLP